MSKFIRTQGGVYVNPVNVVTLKPKGDCALVRDTEGTLHRVEHSDLPRALRRLL